MADRELPLNSPDRFSKRSPRLVRDRVADVGCAGGVYCWRDRALGPTLILRIDTPGEAQAFLDGDPWEGARRVVAPGAHLLAIELSDLHHQHSHALACALTWAEGSEAIVSAADGRWRYSAREPEGDWQRDAAVSASWPALVLPVAGESSPTWLEDLGAAPLRPAQLQARLWVVYGFQVGEA
ncbi:MAG: hypothetical protein AB7N76_36320 [Planctomycetota bacterium]